MAEIEVKQVVVIEPPKEYVLTLDQAEMDLIVGLLGCQSGYDGEKGYRSINNKMYDDLEQYSIKKDVIDILGKGFDGFGDRVARP